MSNRPHNRGPAGPRPLSMPPIITGRTEGTGLAQEYTAEELALLRRLIGAPETCAEFVIIGIEEAPPDMKVLPGYTGTRLHSGGNGDPFQAFHVLASLVDAERADQAAGN